jgi:hypothetical protein
VSGDDTSLTKADLDALRVELREALANAMSEILNAVHSVTPPLRSQTRMAETRLGERLAEIEKQQGHLASAVERLRAEVSSLREQRGESGTA